MAPFRWGPAASDDFRAGFRDAFPDAFFDRFFDEFFDRFLGTAEGDRAACAGTAFALPAFDLPVFMP
jgi:hypothetical protein